jgi:ubiquinol-cytochrome c reductase iron-sulfur subunit
MANTMSGLLSKWTDFFPRVVQQRGGKKGVVPLGQAVSGAIRPLFAHEHPPASVSDEHHLPGHESHSRHGSSVHETPSSNLGLISVATRGNLGSALYNHVSLPVESWSNSLNLNSNTYRNHHIGTAFQYRHYSNGTGSSDFTVYQDGRGASMPHEPDWSDIRRDTDPGTRDASASTSDPRLFTYMMVGAAGAVTAVGVKSVVFDFLASLSAAADTLALAQTEVDLSAIPEGKNVVISWRGKPVFIRHRTTAEIEEASTVDISTLRDPESDTDRVQKPEWLVMLGICSHLGCVPVGSAGDYNGWYCPCHGSHYDISGRIRKGPAPLNLEIPEYKFVGDDKIVIG